MILPALYLFDEPKPLPDLDDNPKPKPRAIWPINDDGTPCAPEEPHK